MCKISLGSRSIAGWMDQTDRWMLAVCGQKVNEPPKGRERERERERRRPQTKEKRPRDTTFLDELYIWNTKHDHITTNTQRLCRVQLWLPSPTMQISSAIGIAHRPFMAPPAPSCNGTSHERYSHTQCSRRVMLQRHVCYLPFLSLGGTFVSPPFVRRRFVASSQGQKERELSVLCIARSLRYEKCIFLLK